MPYAFTLTTTIPASAQEIYDAWLDSVAHSEMTQAAASMSDEVGADVSAWDGHITGRNLELVPGERIVQSWRAGQFDDEHEDSIITLMLEEIEGGTLLTLAHSNVPDGQTSYELGGWQEHYFEPMKDQQAPAKGRRKLHPRRSVQRDAKNQSAQHQERRQARASPQSRQNPSARAPRGSRTRRLRANRASRVTTALGRRRIACCSQSACVMSTLICCWHRGKVGPALISSDWLTI